MTGTSTIMLLVLAALQVGKLAAVNLRQEPS